MSNLDQKIKETGMCMTPKQTEMFIDSLNHRMTKIEGDVGWIKKIMWYMAGIMSVGLAKVVFLGI
jgi:hypothetical protein